MKLHPVEFALLLTLACIGLVAIIFSSLEAMGVLPKEKPVQPVSVQSLCTLEYRVPGKKVEPLKVQF